MRRLAFLFVLVLTAVVGGSAVAYAQAAPRPSVARVELTAAVQPDKTARVTAKYAVNNAEGIRDLKVVNNLADLPGLTIDGLKATSGTTNLQVTSEKKPGFDQVTIQLPADARGRVEYTLEYTASANRDDFRFPVPVPNFPVAASVPSFFATVTLPPNTNFRGDEFPRLVATEQQGGSTVLKMQEVNVPAFVAAPFGQDGTPLFTATNVTTLVSLLFIVLTATWWWRLKAGK